MYDVVQRAILHGGEREAAVCGEFRESYAAWGRRAAGVARNLIDAGLREGDRIGCLFRNSAHASECIAAAALGGFVYVPLNFFLTGSELLHLVRLTGMRALVYHPAFADMARRIQEQVPELAILAPLTSEDAAAPSYERWACSGAAPDCAPARGEDDPFVILFTSGTTGTPKGVTLSHGNVIANAESFVRELEIGPESRGLAVSPHFFSAAINCTVIPCMLAAAAVVFADGFNAPRFLETVERERITHVQLVPTMVIRLLDCPDVRSRNLGSLRTVSYGSAPMPLARLREALDTFGPVFLQTYGMTEVPQLVTVLRKEEHVAGSPRLSSCGRPPADAEIRIVDEAGNDLPPRAEGEILMRGRSLMLGYWDMPEETAAAVKDGWMHSGDLGWRDEDGYLYIVGRKKEVIISGGIKIPPKEIEDVLFTHAAVADVVVAGVPHPEWGEMVKAYIVLKPGQRLSAEEVIAYCGARLASYKKPKAVQFVASLPKTTTGKPIRRGLG